MTSYPPPPQGSQPPPDPPPYEQQPYPAAYPPPPPPAFGPQGPPPPPGVVPVAKVPPIAVLIPLAAVLAVVGAVTPWFRPHGQVRDVSRDFDALYSIKDGKIGLIAPIALVILALGVIGLMRGKVRGRLAGAADPVRAMAKYAIGAGAVSLVCLVIAWFLVTTQYRFEVDGGQTVSFDDYRSQLQALGGSLTRGPQVGYWLTLVAAVLAIAAGVALLVQAKSTGADRPAPPPGAYPPPPPGYLPPPSEPSR